MIQKTFMDFYQAQPESAKIIYVKLSSCSTGLVVFEHLEDDSCHYLSAGPELKESIDQLEKGGFLRKSGGKCHPPGFMQVYLKKPIGEE